MSEGKEVEKTGNGEQQSEQSVPATTNKQKKEKRRGNNSESNAFDVTKYPIVSSAVQPRKKYTMGINTPPINLWRFVRWPRYIRVQRQRRVLLNRMKIPPVINQFTNTLEKNLAVTLFRLMNAYRPETDEQVKARLTNAVVNKQGQYESKKPLSVIFGLNQVTKAIERKRAKLVVIANDVEPIELVLWLPTLCKKKDIPYVIVKCKSRLGQVVSRKTASAIAFLDVHPKDRNDFQNLVDIAREKYNNMYAQTMKQYGKRKQGPKHRIKTSLLAKKELESSFQKTSNVLTS